MYEYSCIIRRVVDGDTVDVDLDLGFGLWKQNERIRLWGIDTPESRTRDSVEKVFGKEASKMVEQYLPEGSRQTMMSVKDKAGKYGRTLGKFIIYDSYTQSKTTLNEWMIKHHYAVAYTGQSKDDVVQAHLENYIQLINRKPELIDETVFSQYINSR
jgi:micrococcal nuclease